VVCLLGYNAAQPVKSYVDNIKMNLQEIICADVDSIEMVQVRD
jgi:hypothetical protein